MSGIKGMTGVRMRMAMVALAMAVLLACAGCAGSQTSSSSESSSASSEAVAQATSIAVSVSVTGPADEVMLAPAVISLEEDSTALEALQASGLDVTVTESSFGPFVEAIDGVAGEGSAGWTYTVNGEMPQVSAGSCVVSDGDAVAWTYADASDVS
ncbi:DUF4430 domain-containing protein [Adlercreutzia murintestinalis]|uniref:DUF4430 domain-containing protein n=1 Tax=Adlercreutzia murintestinalis TaxID=2941325 RepID=UPI00203B6735|nr:DUF4430 domain-containing protein [Adlercreutzia murintestinalis]